MSPVFVCLRVGSSAFLRTPLSVKHTGTADDVERAHTIKQQLHDRLTDGKDNGVHDKHGHHEIIEPAAQD